MGFVFFLHLNSPFLGARVCVAAKEKSGRVQCVLSSSLFAHLWDTSPQL